MSISTIELQQLLNKKDLTLQPNHALNLLVQTIEKQLSKKYGITPSIERGNPIVSIADNYYHLGYKDNEVTLGTRYTKYINEDTMLRTQMSSTIPNLLRNYKQDGDKIWVCPGMVYRRDVRDKTHVGEPHQCDIWYLSQRKQTREDLLQLVESLMAIIENAKGEKIQWRYNETNHPYTDEGIEVEIMYRGNWLELLECGLISQTLLDNNNLSQYGGLALGLGLERLLMIIKDISDIRVINSQNPAVMKQMGDYKKYREVSKQPAMKRDLSIAVDHLTVLEELTEIVMKGVPIELSEKIETLDLLTETAYKDLPLVAIERLGMNEQQKNMLLRVVLRDVANALTHEEANDLYTLIYDLLHEGRNGYKITYSQEKKLA
jgi:phenylalanyl-tRNA synthetase alpha chain